MRSTATTTPRQYVADVLARATSYGADTIDTVSCGSAGAGLDDSSALRTAQTLMAPRTYAMLPAWAMAGGRPAQPIDTRLLENALSLLRTYRLRVTAAREGGHNTHGDGTALDLVPAEPVDQAAWDASAGALARALGWTPACGPSGEPPSVPARPCDPVRRLRRIPGTRLATHLPWLLRRPPAHLVAIPVLRFSGTDAALRLGRHLRSSSHDGSPSEHYRRA